ncbi:N-formylglutamate amidohydrolase [Croceicoccus naphthovorans]|uniref:Uncharacterized protein n=1 Tax=Croceicoccus naphthovorans TaxID=1348774 RepID=A0A0G3XH30_9SPHN|nr:N-formylglutamate amidohydrolase [Croceicoccus naphthovorans]AKM09658.1 hypothetical protein AB433_06140 [Croceicoccus naphthovorans]MBB3990777.1 N-formylglutamate amidohydrolase [Croceicoccus naphthovorans]
MPESRPANPEPTAPERRGEIESGGSIPGLSRPAFTLHGHASLGPVLIAVPHAGRAYPPAVLDRMRSADLSCQRLEDRFVDHVAREAAALVKAPLLVAHAPRAMIDLNREPTDLDPSMFRADEAERAALRRKMPRGGTLGSRSLRGLGLFPRRLPGVGEVWRHPMEPSEAERRIAGIHAPYHDALGRTLEAMQRLWGEVLLLDLHSMPDLPARQGMPPARHVLGDRFGASCDRELIDTALDAMVRGGAVPAYNRPYAGGYVLDRHGNPRKGVHAIQLEVARSLYLDTDRPGAGVRDQAELVSGLVQALIATLTDRSVRWVQAAE